MDPKNVFMFKSVFSFYIKMNTIITFFLVVEIALATDRHFEACKPQNCGIGPNISYPFWIDGVQESFCGFPGFELSCKNKEPMLKISGDEFIIQEISKKEQSLLVTRKQLWDNNSCAPLIHNLTFSSTPFALGSDQVRFIVLFSCTASLPDEYLRYSMACNTRDSLHSLLAIFSRDPLLNYVKQSGNCENSVIIPVDMIRNESLDRVASRNQIIEILNKGFHLRWNASACTECEESGGHCGFDWSMYEFNCFCPDRPHLKHCHSNPKKAMKIGIGVAGGVGGILLTCAVCFIYQRHRKFRSNSSTLLSQNISSEPSSKPDLEIGSMLYPTPIFKYDELVEATENFHSSKELGDGGFGTVYYGKLQDGRVVAVKRLYEHNYKRVEQFMNEIKILSLLRHRHLVSLYGCTSHDSRELLLVYEYVPNGTVADHLHGQHAKAGSLPWPVRMSIAMETADALVYLHATDIIHRDVKTTNILLDNNFHVKVADFGLSRLFPTDATHVSTAPQGTPGYVDPEYYQCYQLNGKSDVYSFGVVLTELISSKPAVDISRHRHEINLANMAVNKILNHALHELVDPSLGFESDHTVRRMITLVAELAFRCLQQEKEMRPTMKEVLECLKKIESDKYTMENGDELDVGAEKGLLKGMNPPFSPDSVTDKWPSITTTPNTSA